MSVPSFIGSVLGLFNALFLYVIASLSLATPPLPPVAALMAPLAVLFPVVPGPQSALAVFVLAVMHTMVVYWMGTASNMTSNEAALGLATPPGTPAPLPPNNVERFLRGYAIGFNSGWNLGVWAMLPAIVGLVGLLIGALLASLGALVALLGPVGAALLAIGAAIGALVGAAITLLAAIAAIVFTVFVTVIGLVLAALAAVLGVIGGLIAALLAALGPLGVALAAALGALAAVLGAILLALGALGMVGAVLALINFLATIPAISTAAPYQLVLGWSSWLMPMSWPSSFAGALMFLVSLITAPFFGPVTVSVDFSTGTIETVGGIGGITGFVGGFNLGNFTFIVGGAAATPFGVPGLSAHETGHTLSVAALGTIWNVWNALEENVLPFRRLGRAYGEMAAESHLTRPGLLALVRLWS